MGVYQYSGRQVDPNNDHGLRDEASVNVLRDEATVFDEKAVRTFVGKPITVDHPHQAVNASNWKDHSRGAIMGALRDGDYVAFDLLLMDAGAIADVDAGKKELSNGYAAELEFGDFTAPDGTGCPVRQSRISDGNHVALVDAGRAGPGCRISDGGNVTFETCDAATIILASDAAEEPKPMKYLTLDGLKVDLADAEAVTAAVSKLQGQLTDANKAKDAAETKVGELTASVQTKDGEIVALNAKLKDAEVTPAKLQLLADARAKVIAAAQSLQPGISVDGKSDVEIRKEAVNAKLGDAAKDMTDAAIEGAFAALTKDVKAPVDNIAPLGRPLVLGDGGNVRDLARTMQYN